MSKIKLSFIINDLYRGGAQRILSDLILQGDKQKFDHEVISFKRPETESKDDTYEKILQESGCKVTYLDGSSLDIFMKLNRHTKNTKPDIVQTFLPYASILARIASVVNSVPVLSLQCNLPSASSFKIQLLDKLTLYFCTAWQGATSGIEKAYGMSNSFFSVSEWTKGRRHFTIYGAVNVDKIRQQIANCDKSNLRKSLNIPDSCPIVMMTARLISWKGHKLLINAVAKIPDVHLLLVGWGPLEEELKTFSKELNISDRVHFLGRRSDVYCLLSISDVYAQTHDIKEGGKIWEGPNLSQMEACAAGVPSVSTAVPYIEELIEDGVTGRLSKLGDIDSLAVALQKTITEKEVSKKLADEATRRVQERFSVEKMVENYQTIWELVSLAKG